MDKNRKLVIRLLENYSLCCPKIDEKFNYPDFVISEKDFNGFNRTYPFNIVCDEAARILKQENEDTLKFNLLKKHFGVDDLYYFLTKRKINS